MYNFIDTNEVSEVAGLPSEALQINGEFIENLIPGYRTLNVSGREALSPELETYETGVRDGSALKSRRYPARIIIVRYQLMASTNEAFREAYNKLASILDVEEAELIFNDEPDKFFKGTLQSIGEVTPGTNSVIGEFEFFCADPFKYSVIEYEANPALDDNSILIDYTGTYKAFPILEAEFYSENEGEAGLTGNGDCGFVAFFNENEKIIQIGNPDETDVESYPMSQTLVNQQFQKETAWNSIAQTNWGMNSGVISSPEFPQIGSVAMQPASYAVTKSPVTSGELLTVVSKEATPYVTYKVSATLSERKENRALIQVTVTTTVQGGSSTTKPTAGAKVTLSKTKIYVSSSASSSADTKTGTYYLWDASIINNRIRITNTSSNVGKSGQVVGWVKVSDINLTASKYSTLLGAEYGLKGAIQFGGGDWSYITIKREGVAWVSSGGSNVGQIDKFTAEVKNIEADTTIIEDVKFKVERTDNNENRVGILDETRCKDFEISAYTAPVVNSWYLMPETYGTGSKWHGPSITRTIPADAAGIVGAENFRFSWQQKFGIGTGSSATQEIGAFQVLLISGKGSSRRIVAGVNIYKGSVGKSTNLRLYLNGKVASTRTIDLSALSGKTSSIQKLGRLIEFNIEGIKASFYDDSLANVAVTEITFYFAQHGTKPVLSYNGLYWAKFIKDNCDIYNDIPNKFSANDVVSADCKSGDIYLNNISTPALGALGNDWEDFCLTPGINQIGFTYSDWVLDAYAPKAKIRYREVFI